MGPTVLIVDDHAGFRRTASLLLRAAGYAVVGEAGDASEAVTSAASLEPDLVLLDVQLPDEDGFAVADRLATLRHPPRVLLISTRDAAAYATRLSERTERFLRKDQLSAATLAGSFT